MWQMAVHTADIKKHRPNGRWFKRPVSRVLSLIYVAVNKSRIIHLGHKLPHASSNLPESIGRTALKHFPIRSCSGWGLPGRSCCQKRRCALTAPFHLDLVETKQSTFCCTFLRVTSTGRYPASCPIEPGLSSRAEAPAILKPS